jgi:RND family efflux transporter MFP subunit
MLLAAILGAGCKQHDGRLKEPPDLPAATVHAQVAQAKKYLSTEEVVGTVRPTRQARIEAKVAGRITQMVAVPGLSVKASDLLVQLDADEIRARYDQALAQRDQAQRELKRFAALVKQKAVTQQEFDAVQLRARVAQAAVTEAETMLGYMRITAPFDGVVTRKLADVGDLAAPGKPLLELEEPTALRLEANVPEALMGKIRLGARMAVRVPALDAELTGTVSEIAPASDPNSRTFLVKLDLPQTDGLRTGQFGRVTVPVSETVGLRVPLAAVVERGQLQFVFVVAGRRAQMLLVKTGKRFGDEVEVASGLSPGELIVTDGAALLVDGQPLEIKP